MPRLHVSGLRASIRELERDLKYMDRNSERFCKKLARTAQSEAQRRYAPWNVTVYTEPVIDAIGSMVVCMGNDDVTSHDGAVVGSNILFAEFGTGLLAGSHPWSTDMPNVYPGSYSETYGTGEYASTGMWHWGGLTFVYGEPTYALYFGAEKAEASAPEVVKEVFDR